MAEISKRPLIFLGVGAINTLLDFAFYTFLTSTLLQGESKIGLAGIVSGTFALLCAFLTHSFITWRGNNISRLSVVKFIAFTGFGMWVIRPLLLSAFIQLSSLYIWVHDISTKLNLPFTYDFIANTAAFGFMVVIVLIYNYYVYARFVFNDRRHTDPENH